MRCELGVVLEDEVDQVLAAQETKPGPSAFYAQGLSAEGTKCHEQGHLAAALGPDELLHLRGAYRPSVMLALHLDQRWLDTEGSRWAITSTPPSWENRVTLAWYPSARRSAAVNSSNSWCEIPRCRVSST